MKENNWGIIGDCNGCNYYLDWRGWGNYVDLVWQGLSDNATKWGTKKEADDVLEKAKPYSKLNLRVALL